MNTGKYSRRERQTFRYFAATLKACMMVAAILLLAAGGMNESVSSLRADEPLSQTEDSSATPEREITAPAEDLDAAQKAENDGMSESFVQFMQAHWRDILRATHEHLFLVFISLVIAVAIALPLGIYLSHSNRPHIIHSILGVTGIIQTIPALALIAFIMVIFAMLNLTPIGQPPALVALVLYALLPILRNTYTAINQVDPAVKEVATGLGMRPAQILFRVELPLALPVIMAGIRISSVWTIGIATLCGYIGAGGLGRIIFVGISTVDTPVIISATIPAALMALVFDRVLSSLERWLTPQGLRIAAAER